jgi:hypothetical protein
MIDSPIICYSYTTTEKFHVTVFEHIFCIYILYIQNTNDISFYLQFQLQY